ncbi:hypothetical protein K450DRAFT_239477 [Umbelopsis ramanniana AG]|uniref:Uncharacterized protein n=1 Tax=Umbelopsis ramanniana AG TaxID=1314678 RepID=A0AAD5HEQ7_UMBRA|nr:uncharacterized protein K450DRAFT_239477 [Umbelopsis ramanniana AG]KAI8579871.1 hypothetical protein K450DRAFT_239477 [Umbelopsis ramanniana AG]
MKPGGTSRIKSLKILLKWRYSYQGDTNFHKEEWWNWDFRCYKSATTSIDASFVTLHSDDKLTL